MVLYVVLQVINQNIIYINIILLVVQEERHEDDLLETKYVQNVTTIHHVVLD